MHDVIVIGGGPAGLAAASWIARYRRSVLLVDGGMQRNLSTRRVHGYLGADPCSPQELLERGRKDLLSYEDALVRDARVDSVTSDRNGFSVDIGGERLFARRLVLSTGVTDVLPDVAGLLDHYGTSVFHCPACDGYEARDLHVALFGWGDHVPAFARGLLRWARSVTIVTEGNPLDTGSEERHMLAGEGIEIVEDDAVELLGPKGELHGARLRSGRTLAFEIAFFSITHEPQTDLARALGCALDDEGYVMTDLEGRTSVEGVYAAGDLTPGTQLVQIAAAKGAAAGIACARSLD